ncbi:MAG: hypothetical protein HY980_04170 [Candidatus Magasanikbacteria bacterium]|nr:hypothetical protein [Candidatus Magasanikbacteria bacterium]
MYFFLKHKLISIALFALTLNLVFGLAPASADLTENVMGQVKAGADKAQFSEAIDPRLAVVGVVRTVLAVVGIIFTVLIVYGGYNYFTSQGEEEKAKKGADIVRMAVIGLIIILFSYSITLFIGSRLPAMVTEGGTVAK